MEHSELNKIIKYLAYSGTSIIFFLSFISRDNRSHERSHIFTIKFLYEYLTKILVEKFINPFGSMDFTQFL